MLPPHKPRPQSKPFYSKNVSTFVVSVRTVVTFLCTADRLDEDATHECNPKCTFNVGKAPTN
eukprot:4519275-Amphidinium_carterae.1